MTSDMSLALIHKFVPKFASILASIPGPGVPKSGTQLIRLFADVINQHLGSKTPEQFVADHATNQAFEDDQEPSNKTIKREWWESKDGARFARALFPMGLANMVTPPYFNRINQGILCQPSAETGFRPIEYIAHHVNRAFCRANMDADDVMNDYVDIFTNPNPLQDDVVDKLEFTFVSGKEMLEYRANRLDLVHAIRLLYFTGYFTYLCNPTAFYWTHPLFLITAVFQAQTNFFPSMLNSLSEAQKKNYLLALGLNVFERIRKPFEAEFFDGADLFPATGNPTNMPQDPFRLGYSAPPAGAPEGAPAGAHEELVFNPTYFLFGEQIANGTNNNGIAATIFDQDVFNNYTAVHDNTTYLPQVKASELTTLMTIICPKDALEHPTKPNYGYKKKAHQIALLKKHITTFNTTHHLYLQELAALTEAQSEADA